MLVFPQSKNLRLLIFRVLSTIRYGKILCKIKFKKIFMLQYTIWIPVFIFFLGAQSEMWKTDSLKANTPPAFMPEFKTNIIFLRERCTILNDLLQSAVSIYYQIKLYFQT